VHDQGWASLRDIQIRSIHEVRGSATADVLISASTAAGKTEAAFLPALSAVAEDTGDGLGILYVAPLKALINDQFGRLETLCDRLGLPLVRWHGDAPDAPKQRIAAKPRRGVALITPESIEALLCRRPGVASALLGRARFVIVDEIHAFLAGPRGLHLASLLRRIDGLATGSARRIGLSATLGDLDAARAWLRPADPERVRVVTSPQASGAELRLQVRGYVEPARMGDNEGKEDRSAIEDVADHLMATLRNRNALVFAGSRQRVEYLSDLLRERCEGEHVPNEFFAHHGNLSKHLREELEARLKAGQLPTTAVCTSTLELGIDIGTVEAVAQVGAPRSLASLRQRLGRSGRRHGKPAVLRLYVIEDELDGDPDPLDDLRSEIVRAVAALRLLGQGFLEAPKSAGGLGSALLHQVLSVICERGGARAEAIHRTLCGPGPFAGVPVPLFADLLRGMGAPEAALIEQAPDGTLMLGQLGERLTAGRDFYAMFESPEEWRLVASGKSLGTLPISEPLLVGNLLVFGGRRWAIRGVDDAAKVVTVEPHKGGRPPRFGGMNGEPVDDRLVAEMLAVYHDDDVPPWLDDGARQLLAQGRAAFQRLGLDECSVVHRGEDVHLLTWRGSRANGLLAVILGAAGLRTWAHDFGVVVSRAEPTALVRAIGELQGQGPPDLESLAADTGALATAKYDGLLAPAVLHRFWAMAMQDVVDGLRRDLGRLALGRDAAQPPD
jgi:ATP-dependent Lhr-like helicase